MSIKKIAKLFATGVALLVLASAAVAFLHPGGLGTLVLGSAALFGSRGEDQAKLKLVEMLKATIRPGVKMADVEELLTRNGIAHSLTTSAQSNEFNVPLKKGIASELVATVSRIRWDSIIEVSVSIVVDFDAADVVQQVIFQDVGTGP
jgi:hypothetical protein